MKRALFALLCYAIALCLVAPVVFFAVLVLAGPHGMLPSWLSPVVVVIGWLVVIILPLWLARFTVGKILGNTAVKPVEDVDTHG